MPAKKSAPSKQIEMFETALKSFWGGKYEQAKKAFEKIIKDYPSERDLIERIKTIITVCDTRMEEEFKPSSAEDLYRAGIYHLNRKEYKESAAYLRRALKKDEDNEAYLFTLACALAGCGENDEALETLKSAVKLNPDNRLHARNSGDFSALAEDKRFRQLTE